MDQLTATALIVALVFNFVVLVLAFAWAIRNRRRTDPRHVSTPARGESRPWWLDQAARAEAAVPEASESDVAGAAAADSRPVDAPHTTSADLPRGAEVLDALEPATAWRSILAREAARVSRYRRPATIVIADLEGTDRLAARLGGESVERLLPAVAGTLRRESRTTDRVVRLANARFGVLLPETDEVAAINWVERVREATDLWLDASAVSLRIAFGWAELGPDADVDAVVGRAYERLDAERRALQPGTRADARSNALARGPERPSSGRRRVDAHRPTQASPGSRSEQTTTDRTRSSLAAS